MKNPSALQRHLPRIRHGLLCAVGLGLLTGTAIGQRDSDRPALKVDQLIQQLGAASYQQRQQAEEKLQDLGTEALPALRAATDKGDLEVQFRSQRLVRNIERQRQQRLLDEFLVNYDPELAQQLNGWTMFQELVGDDREARQLFVGMYDAEPELMSHIGRQSPTLPYLLEKRSIELRPQAGQRVVQLSVPAASTAALLLTTLDPVSNPSPTTRTAINSLVAESSFLRAASESNDPPARRLLAGWVKHAGNISAATRRSVGAKYQLREAVAPAIELIRSRVHGSQIQYAIYTVAQLGTAEQIPVLDDLLDNHDVLSERQRGEDKTFTCQTRDVALAAMIHLIGKHPHDFGFKDLRSNSNSLYALNTAGFDSDEKRDAAFRRWELWVLIQRSEGRTVAEIAVEGVTL